MTSEPSAHIDLTAAIQHLNSGNPKRAEDICRAHLNDGSRHHGEVLHILALSLRAQGRLDEALTYIKRTKKKLSNNASVFNSLGLIYLDKGDTKQAIGSLRKATKLDPDLAAAHANLGHAFSRIRSIDDAKSAYSAALAINPGLTDAYVNFALLLKSCGELESFESIAKPISNISSHDPGWQFVEGLLYLEKDQPDRAEGHFRHGLTESPNSVPLLGNLGVALARQGKEPEAIEYFKQALELDPKSIEVRLNLADCFKYSAPVRAREHIDLALNYNPDNAHALDLLGFTWMLDGDLSSAITAFDKAIIADPSFSRATIHKAGALFLSGQLGDAWDLYAKRYEESNCLGNPIGMLLPLATSSDLEFGNCLVWTDQGIGDEILQLSMISDIVEKYENIHIATTDRLVGLVRRSFPKSTCIDRNNLNDDYLKKQNIKVQIPAATLGKITRREFREFPDRSQFLVADREDIAEIRAHYSSASDGLPVIGLSWKSSNVDFGAKKSISLPELLPILSDSRFRFVCLQYGDITKDLESLPRNISERLIIDQTIDPLKDLDRFAAQISALDMVITTSNTTAHMAGALGRTTWTMVPRMGPGWLWYWFGDREDSPWYPTIRLFRQSEFDNWTPVISAITQQLNQISQS